MSASTANHPAFSRPSRAQFPRHPLAGPKSAGYRCIGLGPHLGSIHTGLSAPSDNCIALSIPSASPYNG